ncbi:Tn3 family transposase [Rhizobium paknamense]|uniref:Tn3 family transposase n=1 Tax=Rhizobium paknamense TaxID=1206817 RepID=UPI0035219568
MAETRPARAQHELGRLIKTLYLPRVLDGKSYRRRIIIHLNRGEGRHQLAHVIFHGKRAELRQRYCAGQEEQLRRARSSRQSRRALKHDLHGCCDLSART